MLRHIAFTLVALSAAAAFADEREHAQTQTAQQGQMISQDDRFVVSGDECGASRYQHLVGREYAKVYNASMLPAGSDVQNRPRSRTLEYRPQQLNVVVGDGGRIIAIGCF